MSAKWFLPALAAATAIAAPADAFGARMVSPGAAAAGKVPVQFYTEALWPACVEFATSGLQAALTSGVLDIADLDIFPWGNAYYQDDKCPPDSPTAPWDRTACHCWLDRCTGGETAPEDCFAKDAEPHCQHGQTECDANRWEACAVTVQDNQNDQTSFVVCFEGKAEGATDLSAVAQSCANEISPDLFASVQDCFNGADGDEAVRTMAKGTAALGRSRPGTPWVVVNGTPLTDPSTLVAAICAAYNGTAPAACSSYMHAPALRSEPCPLDAQA